jgi:hypothetical protein
MTVHSYHISALGLVVDIIGAFFLAAEAIKIENLRNMRDRVLARLRHATISPPFQLQAGEELTPERERQFRVAFEFGPPWGAKHPHLFTLLHYLAGILVCLIANWFSGGRLLGWLVAAAAWIIAFFPWPIAYGVLALLGLWLIVGGLGILGEIVHILITSTISFSMEVIEFIDRHTADGGVGILGFSFLLIGFLLQLAGTIASAP